MNTDHKVQEKWPMLNCFCPNGGYDCPNGRILGLNAFNPNFLATIQASMPIGEYLTPVTASLFILVEGIAISVIGAYIVTRVVDMGMTNA